MAFFFIALRERERNSNLIFCQSQVQTRPYLTADHDVGHFGLAVTDLPLVVPGPDGENKISRVALALSDQKAAMLSLLGQ